MPPIPTPRFSDVNSNCLLEIDKLTVTFRAQEGLIYAVDELSFALERGRTLGIAGESGCGKSVSTQAILRLIPKNGTITQGQILYNPDGYNPIDITAMKSDSTEIRAIRGREMSIIFQEPMTSFSPVITVGKQIDEVIMLHQDLNKKEARERSIEMLTMVGMPNPQAIHSAYTYNLSGGMRQRAMIAMALSCQPKLLIADEPTTAIDVTTQAMILKLIKQIQKERDLSLIFITHDLAVIAELADDILIMYMGKEVEYGPVIEIFNNTLHPYTKGLLQSIPVLGKSRAQTLNSITGTVPDHFNLPKGCLFNPRCSRMIKGLCDVEKPPFYQENNNHFVRCFLYKNGKIK